MGHWPESLYAVIGIVGGLVVGFILVEVIRLVALIPHGTLW